MMDARGALNPSVFLKVCDFDRLSDNIQEVCVMVARHLLSSRIAVDIRNADDPRFACPAFSGCRRRPLCVGRYFQLYNQPLRFFVGGIRAKLRALQRVKCSIERPYNVIYILGPGQVGPGQVGLGQVGPFPSIISTKPLLCFSKISFRSIFLLLNSSDKTTALVSAEQASHLELPLRSCPRIQSPGRDRAASGGGAP